MMLYYALRTQEKPALEGEPNYSQRCEEISKGGSRTNVSDSQAETLALCVNRGFSECGRGVHGRAGAALNSLRLSLAHAA